MFFPSIPKISHSHTFFYTFNFATIRLPVLFPILQLFWLDQSILIFDIISCNIISWMALFQLPGYLLKTCLLISLLRLFIFLSSQCSWPVHSPFSYLNLFTFILFIFPLFLSILMGVCWTYSIVQNVFHIT